MITDLERFITAQDKIYATVISELNSGHKCTHWMWYVFPQFQGLGKSDTTQFYAIKDKNEALSYLNHPVLGQRLIECTSIINKNHVVFPYPDDLKLKSSMTLFHFISGKKLFEDVLYEYFNDKKDERTIEMLMSQA